MKVYLVGGAVRDYLMGKPIQDRDYVVVGSTPAEMEDAGFVPVGAEFPVFIHPETGDEYALARTERKNGEGYLGFDVDYDPSVTLKDDTSRRDLTINSMAMHDGIIIDYHGGMDDLENKVFRHVSDAFSDDPVRVLRIARFRARHGSEWTIADETKNLIQNMAKRGVLNELTKERVWKEFERAMMEPTPRLFFDTLFELDALHVLFPEVYQLKTATESMKWHPEGNSYEHTMLVLTQAARYERNFQDRFNALVHDFGKALSPKNKLPAHHGHEVTGVPLVETFANRIGAPRKMRLEAMKMTRWHMHMHKLYDMKGKTIVKMFDEIDISRKPSLAVALHNLGCADHRGRLGSEDADIEHLAVLMEYAKVYHDVKWMDFDQSKSIPAIKQAMFNERARRIDAVKQEWKHK